jgi:hypothetical protein
MENSNLSKIKPKLRTNGRVSGNFGRNKIQGKLGTLDLSSEVLNKENLQIPNRAAVYERLEQAYNTTTDPKLRATLAEMLRKRRATVRVRDVTKTSKPRSDYWEEVNRVR